MMEILKLSANAGLIPPKAILFDWDGTLIDSLPIIHAAYNHTLKKFGHAEMSVDDARHKIRKSAREIFPEIFGDQAAEAQEVFYTHIRAEHLKHLAPIAGAKEFVVQLSRLNIPLGIVSNKRDDVLQREVTALGWTPFFRVVIGAGVAARDKPAADPLLLAAAQINIMKNFEHVWYIGDTETDMQAALAADMAPVFIEHGLGSRADCVRVGVAPTYMSGFTDLWAVIEKSR